MRRFFNTDYILKKAINENEDFKNWPDFEKEKYEGYGYLLETLGIQSTQKILSQLKHPLVVIKIYQQI